MARQFLIPINLNQNELQNPRYQQLAADPGSPVQGQFYWNTTDKRERDYDGTAWEVIPHLSAASTSAALTVGGVAAGGSSLYASRMDHVHGMPSNATISSDGFMPQAMFTSLTNATAAPTASTLMLRDGSARSQVADPVAAQDIATKNYVDGVISGVASWKQSVRLASTAVLTITARTTQTLSIGATTLTLDGSAVANGDRVLIKDNTSGVAGAGTADNGFYVVSGVGTAVVLTRVTDADTWNELPGAAAFVNIGTVNADTAYVCTSDLGGTLGTTAVTFVQFGAVGGYSAANDPGVTGTGVYDNTTGNQFRFRGIKAASTKITIALSTKDITVDVNEANFKLTMTLLGDTVYGGAAGALTVLAGNITTTKMFLSQTGSGAASAAPAWAALAAADIPNLDASKITTGTLVVARGGTGAGTFTANGVLYGNGTAALQVTAASAAIGNVLITAAAGGAPAFSSLNLALAGTVGASILAVANGGTGVATLASNGVVYGNGAGVALVTAASAAIGNILRTTTAGGAPSFGSIDLAAAGAVGATILAVPNGGTGVATLASNGVLYGNGTGVVQVTSASAANNQVLITATSGGVPSWATLTTAMLPSTLANKFSSNLVGAATSYVITHNLGTLDVVVNVVLISTGETVECDIVRNTTNQVTLSFTVAPATNTYRVVVIG